MNLSSVSSIRREQRLAHGPRGDVWRVRTPDGRAMVAKQAVGPTRGERSQLRDLVRRGRTLGLPLLPFVELFEAGGDVWVLREYDCGVPLSKLALSSPLSHRQAAATAAACLQALSQLHEAGLCHGRVHAGNVFVEPDGAIRVVDGGIGAPRNRREQQTQWANDMKATAALVYTAWPDWEYEAGRRVYELLEAGRWGDAAAAREGLELLAASLPPADNRPSADLALAALSVRLRDEEQVKPPVRPRRPATAARPQDVSIPTQAQLAKPASMLPPVAPTGVPVAKRPSPPPVALPPNPPPVAQPPNPPPVAPPPSPPPVMSEPWLRARLSVPTPSESVLGQQRVYRWVPARRNEDALRGWMTRTVIEPALRLMSMSAERSRRFAGRLPRGSAPTRRTPVAAAVAASVAVVVGLAIGHAVAPSWPPVAAPQGPAANSHAPRPASPRAPGPASATLQPAAPASAGFVRQVQLQPLGACESGGRCEFRSELDLQAPHEGTGITWEVVAVDRCTGVQSILRTSTTVPDPSWNVVWTSDQLTLPSNHPTLLYTVTVSPWRAASPPVEIGGATSCSQPT